MGIVIRKKVLKNGFESIYLDINFRGKRKYEFLNLKYKSKPANLIERNSKKDKEQLAKRIALKRETELIEKEYGMESINKKDTDFFSIFQDFIEARKNLSDIRGFVSTLNQLKKFSGIQKLYCKEITESFLERFSKYLQSNHKGESAYNYFKKLKRLMKYAVAEKYMQNNTSLDIRCPKGISIEKAVLNFEELELLAYSHCSNANIKRAFLFCSLTGLRFCDVKVLKWTNINNNILDIIQQKTKNRVTISLNADALFLLAKPKDKNGFVFELPTHNGCLKVISTWVKKAGITKRITWHCARHSFATNLTNQGTDILITSKLLGHTSLKCTTRYTRVNEVLRNDAVNKFPSILHTKNNEDETE